VTQPLTPLERRVYHYLLDFLSENTYQPSIREIGRKFRIKSTKTVSDLLQSLAAKGYIERDPSRSRGVRLVGHKGTAGTQPVPYYGQIHAGAPAPLPEDCLGHITMDRRFVPSEQTFFFKVQGESMIGRGINPGDFVMVDPAQSPADGTVVAARLGHEATVKTLTHRDGETVLVPANPKEEEIVVRESDDFAVLGVVAGIFRPLFDGGVPAPTSDVADAVAAEAHAAADRSESGSR
jgi:repressor LexA